VLFLLDQAEWMCVGSVICSLMLEGDREIVSSLAFILSPFVVLLRIISVTFASYTQKRIVNLCVCMHVWVGDI
jgi:hypothetical protein